MHARGFARAFTAAAEAPVTPSASSRNSMNTKHDVHAFNNAKPLRFTGASRITLDQLEKYIHLYLATYARVSRVHITYYTGCDSFIVLTPTFSYNHKFIQISDFLNSSLHFRILILNDLIFHTIQGVSRIDINVFSSNGNPLVLFNKQ